MHIQLELAVTFVFLSILSMASSLQVSRSPRTGTNVVVNGLDVRQVNIIADGKRSSSIHHTHTTNALTWFPVINDIINGIVEKLITDIFNFDSDAHAAESNFTQQTIISLMNQYPDKNQLIFHNQDSTYSLGTFCLICYRPFLAEFFSVNGTHVHHELDLGLGFTQGYEIWVFDYGNFSLAGDGGSENWAAGGCLSGPSSDVIFTQIQVENMTLSC